MDTLPYMGEIGLATWDFATQGWAECNGQVLPINQNQALFSLLGTVYGGNGQTTFALPDLRGRAPIHEGAGFTRGQAGGQEFHTVTQSEMPAHNHSVNGSLTQGDKNTVDGNILAHEVGKPYGAFTSLTTLNPGTITNIGGSQPHENRQPYTVLNFQIALIGVFPSSN